MKTLGTKISEYRKLKGMTQEDLAQQLSVSSQAVSKWENDLSTPDLSLLIQLSDLFHVSLDNLIREKETTLQTLQIEEPLRKPIEQMLLKIVVDSKDGDRVRVNLPVTLIQAGIEMGMAMPQVNGNDAFKNVDLNMLLQMINQGIIGKLIEVDSADGDHVEIYVE